MYPQRNAPHHGGMNETERLLTRGEVERRVGLRRSSLYREMRQGRFPLPVRAGPRAVRWPSAEIEAWIASRPRSRGDGIDRPGGKRGA